MAEEENGRVSESQTTRGNAKWDVSTEDSMAEEKNGRVRRRGRSRASCKQIK